MVIRPLVLAAACMLAFSVHAALFEDDEARRAILDLRQRVDSSQQRLNDESRRAAEDSAQLRRTLLEMSNQIDGLRNEISVLRGQTEQLGRAISDVQRNQKDLLQSTEERLKKVEPGKANVDGREITAEPAEKQEFDNALATLRRGDFASAQLGFANFLKRFPQSGYKTPALFWLGNAQYALRDYRSAVANFRALVAADPEHARAPEAMLSSANCLVEMKEVKAARKTLEDLVKAYPRSESASVASERLSKIK